YTCLDPEHGGPWPTMPDGFQALAGRAATRAGFGAFVADSCLLNCYAIGAGMHLHQDKDEQDLGSPIVSVSLGLACTFVLGGLQRGDPTARVTLRHGDVVVWGGPARLRFHGVLPLKRGDHPCLGPRRMNLTFRRAG
ncbi:MAG: alpha-ketoglutarate-dependent dioxygenase AlkB, partial [Deltaproteobacteria bacterium]